MKYYPPITPGFTLIEMVIALSIFSVLMSLGLWVGLDFYGSYVFKAENTVLTQLLLKARSESMDNVKNTRHGVRVEPGYYVLFAENFSVYDQRVPRSGSIKLSGLAEVLFDRLSGNCVPGQITLSDGKRTAVVHIYENGRMEEM